MTKKPQKPSQRRRKRNGSRTLWIAIISICVIGMFLCGAMIPAYRDDPLPLIGLAALFATGAIVAGTRL